MLARGQAHARSASPPGLVARSDRRAATAARSCSSSTSSSASARREAAAEVAWWITTSRSRRASTVAASWTKPLTEVLSTLQHQGSSWAATASSRSQSGDVVDQRRASCASAPASISWARPSGAAFVLLGVLAPPAASSRSIPSLRCGPGGSGRDPRSSPRAARPAGQGLVARSRAASDGRARTRRRAASARCASLISRSVAILRAVVARYHRTMDIRMDGKAAMVTGASRGIGLATARGSARPGPRPARLSASPEGSPRRRPARGS